MNWIIALAVIAALIAVALIVKVLGTPPAFFATARVVDGDTLRIHGQRIRLFAMDAPELGQSQGYYAKQVLARLVDGQTLEIHPIKRDRWGRIVARVYNENGADIGQLMVAKGFALAATGYGRDYLRAQHAAKRSGAGFWRLGGVQNGAEFRARS